MTERSHLTKALRLVAASAIFSCASSDAASVGDAGLEGGDRATEASVDASTADASPNSALTNDGDRFLITYAPYTHGAVSEYRLYSMRNAADPSRIMVDRTASGLTMVDPYVYDGAHVYYRVVAVVDGSEVLVFSADGAQPVRAWSPPTVITAPGTYSGNWRSLDPAIPAVSIANDVSGVILTKSRIASRGDGIVVGAGATARVDSTRGWGLHPMTQDGSNGKFVSALKPRAVVVEHTYAEAWLFDVYVDGQLDARQQSVVVRYNRMRNVQGRQTNADGTYKPLRFTKGGVAHAVQLNAVSSCANAEIAWNEVSQEPSIGFVEDIINVYESSGLPNSPILVHDNVVYGGYATEPGKPAPPSGEGGGAYSGCGIISDGADPNGTETLNGHTEIRDNIVIATTNCGIGLAGGSDVRVHDNRMVSSGLLEDGTVIWASNVGIYLWKQYQTSFHNNTIVTSTSGWAIPPEARSNSGKTTNNNPSWFPDDGLNGSKAGYGDVTTVPLPITIESERGEYQRFWTRTRDQKVTIGLF